MTEREQEIFHIIEQNPAISQNELAAQLNLARSSVAVHIANLQKKGYIRGKGYIVNDSFYVVAWARRTWISTAGQRIPLSCTTATPAT